MQVLTDEENVQTAKLVKQIQHVLEGLVVVSMHAVEAFQVVVGHAAVVSADPHSEVWKFHLDLSCHPLLVLF